MIAFLHSHAHTDTEHASLFHGFLEEVLLDGLIDSLKIIPILFITYLIMEFIEHKASDRTIVLLGKSGKAGPLVGALLGIVPQCAFSTMAANFYTGRVITLGTLIAVFLATSDEMLPIMISGGASAGAIFTILGYKLAIGILMGFAIDIVLSITKKKNDSINIDEICDNDNCHCERGIFFSALHHTVTITLFIFITTVAVNSLVFFIGADTLGGIMSKIPVISHLLAAITGLLPGCATSVALTTLGMEGIISGGTMMAGLFSNAGVGLLVLIRLNRHLKNNLVIIGLLVTIGFVFGLIFDGLGLSALLV